MPQMHFLNGAFTLHCPVVGGARLEERSSIESSNLAANQGGASAWAGTRAQVLLTADPTPNQRCATGSAAQRNAWRAELVVFGGGRQAVRRDHGTTHWKNYRYSATVRSKGGAHG